MDPRTFRAAATMSRLVLKSSTVPESVTWPPRELTWICSPMLRTVRLMVAFQLDIFRIGNKWICHGWPPYLLKDYDSFAEFSTELD